MTIETKNIEASTQDIDPSGGTIFTRGIIFERPDLFEQCPQELQKAIILIHKGETLRSHMRHEEARILLGEVYKILFPSEEGNKTSK